MDRMIETVRALRDQLQQLEAALATRGALTDPAWVELDEDGTLTALSPAAALQFELDPETSVGVPLTALMDLRGDLLADTFLRVRTGVDEIPALRIPGTGGGKGKGNGKGNGKARGGERSTPARIVFGLAGTLTEAMSRALDGDPGAGGSGATAEEQERAEEAERQFRHDLANIHGIIRGHAELLAMELDTERVTRTTAEILEAVRRAQQLIAARRNA